MRLWWDISPRGLTVTYWPDGVREGEFDAHGIGAPTAVGRSGWQPRLVWRGSCGDGWNVQGGNVLARASMIAGEYGLPAVVAAPCATVPAHEREVVTGDGSAGTVTLDHRPFDGRFGAQLSR